MAEDTQAVSENTHNGKDSVTDAPTTQGQTLDTNNSPSASQGSQAAENAQGDSHEATLEELIEALSGSRRRARQDAAHQLAERARNNAEPLVAHARSLIDALFRPEAQTRWEILDCLYEIAPFDANALVPAFEGAESALFDEGSATVRLAAFRFLARFASTNPRRSDKVWPILDEAIQCYHGDPEYREMLTALLELANGSITKATRRLLIERISFDAENGRGYIRTCSAEIVVAARSRLK